jgi:3-oxochol-4-en-24-oyl-CoA dehydrogenase
MREARRRAYAPRVDLGLPGDDDPRRRGVRDWLDEHSHPTGRQLAEAGYVAPHWAPPYGLDADPLTQLMIDEELRRAGVRRPVNPIGIGWAGPTLMYAGTAEQKDRWLWPLLSGEEFWCQLFSEPGAGSDLASLSTRAERDGDHWVVNGQKVWTSYAHIAKWGILLARTDPAATKHVAISYFICPMDAPGIEIRPLIDMTGEHAFNEVFLTDVRIPADHLVGPEHGGWELAKVTLGNERVSLSGEGALWGMGPTAEDLVDLIRCAGGAPDPSVRDRLVGVWIEAQILRCRPSWPGGLRGRRPRSGRPSPTPTASTSWISPVTWPARTPCWPEQVRWAVGADPAPHPRRPTARWPTARRPTPAGPVAFCSRRR